MRSIFVLLKRRWLAFGNPALRDIITKWLGTEAWIKDLDIVAGLRQHANNEQLHEEWNQVLSSLLWNFNDDMWFWQYLLQKPSPCWLKSSTIAERPSMTLLCKTKAKCKQSKIFVCAHVHTRIYWALALLCLQARRQNKLRLAQYIYSISGIKV